MIKTIKDDNKDKEPNKSEEDIHRTNSFSNKSSSIQETKEKEDSIITRSYMDLNRLGKMEEKILEKANDICPTVLAEKIIKHSSSKGLKIPMIKTIAGEKTLQNLSTLTTSLNEVEADKTKREDYLQLRNITKISDKDFEIIKNEIKGSDNLKSIYSNIMNKECIPFNEVFYEDNVGCLLPLVALIESKYNNDPLSIEELSNKYTLLKDYIYNYRFIKGDGNCFYRSVIFRYFEIIILNKNIELLKNIISEMKESFDSKEIRSRIRIKFGTILNTNNVLQLMLIILELLEKGKFVDAHYFFVKTINITPNFDYGLIIYFRYIFYKYIKANESKLYLENFPIKIGNLLPSSYETSKGEFLFNKFYYCYLLSMFKDAEKIIIYLTPFVLGISLDIIVFDDNEDEIIKKVNYTGTSEYNFGDDKIFVLNIMGHYELLYSENDNIKYKNIFKQYTNNYLGNLIPNGNKDENINKGINNNTGGNEDNNKVNTKEGDKDDNNIKNKDNNINNDDEEKNKDNNKENNKDKKLMKSPEMSKEIDLNNKDIEKDEDILNNCENIFIYDSNSKDKNIRQKETTIKGDKNLQDYKNTNSIKIANFNNTKKTNIIDLTHDNNDSKIKTPNYKFRYSDSSKSNYGKNANKSYEINKNKIKIINKLETDQTPNPSYNSDEKNDKKNIDKYFGKNNEENISEAKNVDTEIKQKVKESINIKSMNLFKKINTEDKKEKNNINYNEKESSEKPLQKEDNLKSNKLMSKIDMSPKKTIEESEDNYNKCHICSSEYRIKGNTELIPNTCYNCLRKEIIIQLYPVYLSYVEKTLNKISYDSALKNNFSNFLKEVINIFKKKISIENSINELNFKIDERKKIFKTDENTEMITLFHDIKKRFCLFCLKELSIHNYIIPCGCQFCSIDHVKKYFHLKNKINNDSFICVCSYNYSNDDLYDLGLFFKKNKLYSLKNDIINILNNFLIDQCCFCSISLESSSHIKIKYLDLEKNLKNNLILDDCTKINHFICETCSFDYYKNETFFCNICKRSHIYIPK